jgi:acyl-CoA hydrolase
MRIVSETEIVSAIQARAAVVAKERPEGAAGPWYPRVVASGNFATPEPLLKILDGAIEGYRLLMIGAAGNVPARDGVVLETPFTGSGMRKHPDNLHYLPMRLSLVPELLQRSRPPDIVLLHTSPASDGKVSLGVEVNILVSAVEQTRARGGLVIAQLNPNMPYTLGDGELPVEDIDLGFEVDEPLLTTGDTKISESAQQIGELIAPMVGDCSTLQLGIGGIPDAVLQQLLHRKGLGIWTEMISNGVFALEKAGALDPARPIITSFLFGSEDLYHWVDHNPRVQMRRTETSNDPGMIARQPAVVSINGAMQADLYAQVNATRINGRIYSGFGGQTDFTVGALHSPGGQAIIALNSWHAKSDSSTVVPVINGQVTSFQHSALVTEQGVAHVFGSSQQAQAKKIIENIAHPRARDWLREEAEKMGLLKR